MIKNETDVSRRIVSHEPSDLTLTVTRWVTRERPKIDRIACPWVIRRFIDPEAEFLFVPSGRVLVVAAETGAIPYDVPGVELGHVGDRCTFDAFLSKYQLNDPVLHRLSVVVRGADTSRFDLAPEAAGLYAISRGLSELFPIDYEMLWHGLLIYDALYSWCAKELGQPHNLNPQEYYGQA
jgi:hypothetical protein